MKNFENYLNNKRILFAKVQDLPDYKDTQNDRVRANYKDYSGCNEINNFKLCNDGYIYGYTELNGKKIDIEKLGAKKGSVEIDNCLVVFVSDDSKIVGYYINATIFDNYERGYCFKVEEKNAILLKEEDRIDVEQRKGLHYGQNFLKYVDEKNIDYVKNILKNIENQPSEFQEQAHSSNMSIIEEKIERQHLIQEGRLSPGKVTQLKKKLGYKCAICDFQFKDKYGEIGYDFIELHHLIPYYKLDKNKTRELTDDDFVVLCSNCHRMIHRLKKPFHNKLDVNRMKKLILHK